MNSILAKLGVPVRWVVIGTDRAEFFSLTKRLHNLIHGQGNPEITAGDREVYEAVNRENAAELKEHIQPDDIVVVHDPQPCALGTTLKRELGVRTIWRCHIGIDERLPATRAAWKFLEPYASTYDQAVFSAAEYIPDFLAGYASIIHPALDPCSHKNRELPPHKLMGVLCNAGLERERQPVVTPPFRCQAQRLNRDGTFVPTTEMDDIGLLYRTVVTQISRWDRLKGYKPLMDGFVQLKRRLDDPKSDIDSRHRHRLEIVRLVLGGPDPASIQDDPEGKEVLEELIATYLDLPAKFQEDIALMTFPMESRKENALMVNALQRCSTVIVQNSLREGFGLTATEAMWKRVPVIGTPACGLRQQIRNGIDGILTHDPEDPDEVADKMDFCLRDPAKSDQMARTAQRHVYDRFLIFSQIRQWLQLLASCAEAASKPV